MKSNDYLNTLVDKCVQCEDRLTGGCLPKKKRYRIFLEVEQGTDKKTINSCGWWSGESFYLSSKQDSHVFKDKELAENTASRLKKTVHPRISVKETKVFEFYEKTKLNCKKKGE
jgi:hypothetical protein